jgi:hypothetical protein
MSTLLRETQPAQNRIAGYLPQHADANGNYVPTGENFPLPVLIKMIGGMMPVQFQESLRTQLPVQTHAAVPVGANAWSAATNFIDVKGYDKVGINVSMTSGTGMTVKIETSFDGTAYFSEKTIYDGASAVFADVFDIPAPYIRITIKNKDTGATKTTNAQIFAKS